jgi:hypothetical protein
MINLYLAVMLIMTPLKPANIPPNWIYLGEKVEPIKAIKTEPGMTLTFHGAALSVTDFIRVKGILENEKDLCIYAIDEALKECEKGMNKALNEAYGRENNHLELVKAYETRLGRLETSLLESQKQTKLMLYIATGAGVVATLFTTMYFAKD